MKLAKIRCMGLNESLPFRINCFASWNCLRLFLSGLIHKFYSFPVWYHYSFAKYSSAPINSFECKLTDVAKNICTQFKERINEMLCINTRLKHCTFRNAVKLRYNFIQLSFLHAETKNLSWNMKKIKKFEITVPVFWEPCEDWQFFLQGVNSKTAPDIGLDLLIALQVSHGALNVTCTIHSVWPQHCLTQPSHSDTWLNLLRDAEIYEKYQHHLMSFITI